MKILFNKFEMIDHSGKVLIESLQEKEILAKAGREGDFIRKTRGKEVNTTHRWDTNTNTWNVVQ